MLLLLTGASAFAQSGATPDPRAGQQAGVTCEKKNIFQKVGQSVSDFLARFKNDDPGDPKGQSKYAYGMIDGGSKWTREVHKLAVDMAKGLATSGRNVMGPLCYNFLKMSVAQRQQVLAKTVMVLGYAESNFRPDEHGDESNDYRKAWGVFQLAEEQRDKFNCSRGDIRSLGRASIDCVYKVFAARDVTSFNYIPGVFETNWSVLWPGKEPTWYGVKEDSVQHPMENRFMPSFAKYVPECKYDPKLKPSTGKFAWAPVPRRWVNGGESRYAKQAPAKDYRNAI